MAQQRADDPKDPVPQQETHARPKHGAEDPSGHNVQIKPAQQEQIAHSEEHRGDDAGGRKPS